jgi:hypothetical protein
MAVVLTSERIGQLQRIPAITFTPGMPQLPTFNKSLESPIDRIIEFFNALRAFIDSWNLLSR